MKTPTKTAIAMFGGAAALAVTVGFGGVGMGPAGSPSTPNHSASSPTPGRLDAGAPVSHVGVHDATLTGCIPGANC